MFAINQAFIEQRNTHLFRIETNGSKERIRIVICNLIMKINSRQSILCTCPYKRLNFEFADSKIKRSNNFFLTQ